MQYYNNSNYIKVNLLSYYPQLNAYTYAWVKRYTWTNLIHMQS